MSLAAVTRRVSIGPLAGAGALVLAALAATPGLALTQPVAGAEVNAFAETDAARQPLYFASAALPRAGQLGLSLQAVGAREQVRYPLGAAVTRVDTDALITTGSISWSPTGWLAVGAYGAKARADVRASYPAPAGARVAAQVVEPTPDQPPSRQGTRTAIGGDELGLHARLGLWRSASGATRVTATGRLRDRPDAAIAGVAGMALQQQLGRVTLHVAPGAWFADNARASLEINAASAFALGTRSSLTAELLHHRGTGATGDDVRSATEAAGGMRHRFGRLALDLGVRHLVGYEQPVRDGRRTSALLATHWKF